MTEATKKREKELKLTAALYAKYNDIVEHVRTTGKLPETISKPGIYIGARSLIEARGTDITLTPDEQLVYDAIIKEKRTPGGSVILTDKE